LQCSVIFLKSAFGPMRRARFYLENND